MQRKAVHRMSLEGKVALVTGASRGIGRRTAEKLYALGAAVALNYNASSEPAMMMAASIRQHGGRALPIQADVSDPKQCEAMINVVEHELGPIDILINNAGFVRDRLLLRMSVEDWDAVWATDFQGSAGLARLVMRGMIERNWGRVVNVASIVGLVGNAGQANYAAAKGAMIGLTKDLSTEAAKHNVTVNCVIPGYIATDATAALEKEHQDAWLAQIPMGRWGEPEEVAGAIVFLAGHDASYITGQSLVIDGGMLNAR
jgi:3-oxoacyl-[acyl-carrier protein] reductase